MTVSAWDGAGYLTEFLDGLARDFRGWEGVRSWVNNELVVAATFGSGGHVCLSWTLRADVLSSGWEHTVTTVIDAGEELTTVGSGSAASSMMTGAAVPVSGATASPHIASISVRRG
ncbi:DUF6228 family protein [Streptomyces sp. NPDC051773]|uniref:DUF6228 family protein n=1 Tax=Streptomyces sp. NPDC051773 TaxID=3156682 RepID=UPI003439E0B7